MVECPSFLGAVGSQFTIEKWVYNQAGSGERIIYCQEDFVEMKIQNNIVSIAWQPYWNWVGGPTVSANTWIHIAATYDGVNQKIFINGVESFLRAQTGSMNANTQPFRIGARGRTGTVPSTPFVGKICNLRVWYKALSSEEIKKYMYESPATETSGLRGWWKLNEGQGSLARDYSPFHNDGIITGATWSSGNSVFTLRPREGYFGGGAIAVEEGTTNLTVNPSFNTTSNWNLVTNSPNGSTFTTDGKWGKIYVPSGDTGFYYYIQQNIARTTPANTPVTFSMVFKNNTIGKFALRLVMFVGGTAPQQPMTEVILDGSGIPKRYSVTATHTAESSALRIDVLAGNYYTSFGGLSNVTFEFTDAQCEQKSFSTSFVNGTRPIGELRYPVNINKDEFMISFWAKKIDNTQDTRQLLGLYRDDTLLLWWDIKNNTNVTSLDWVEGGSSRIDYTVQTGFFQQWNMYTLVWKNKQNRLYINGELIATGVQATGTLGSVNRVRLCRQSVDAQPVNNILFDELRIDNVARTDDEIAAWYYSNSPFWPRGIYRKSY
jgi:hypothetical protein